MDLIGVYDHKIHRLKGETDIVDKKFQGPLQHQKDLNGTMPVFGSAVVAVLALKQEQFKRDILIGNDQLM